jgi:hypothetical protein
MKGSLRERFGFWLERFRLTRLLVLRHDGYFGVQARYINRVNGHVVVGKQ